MLSGIPAPGDMLTFNHGARMTKPRWCAPDHHLPYQNGLCCSVHRGLCNPFLWSICSGPLSLLIKKPLSPMRGRNGLCDISPHLPGDKLWDVNPPSSRWLASENKPLSFTSAPASQLSPFRAAGCRTCFQLHFQEWRPPPQPPCVLAMKFAPSHKIVI